MTKKCNCDGPYLVPSRIGLVSRHLNMCPLYVRVTHWQALDAHLGRYCPHRHRSYDTARRCAEKNDYVHIATNAGELFYAAGGPA